VSRVPAPWLSSPISLRNEIDSLANASADARAGCARKQDDPSSFGSVASSVAELVSRRACARNARPYRFEDRDEGKRQPGGVTAGETAPNSHSSDGRTRLRPVSDRTVNVHNAIASRGGKRAVQFIRISRGGVDGHVLRKPRHSAAAQCVRPEAGIKPGPREAMQGRQLRQGISRSVAPLNSTRPSRRGSPGGDLILAPEFRRAA
jgi:hypothetical protein